jgi:RND family efflux transporter MFP subunit
LGFVKLVQSRQPPPKLDRPQFGLAVEAVTAEVRDMPVKVRAFGTVRARKEVEVTSQIKGQVVEVSHNLVSGGFVSEGELLLRVEPRDFELAVEAARAEVARAEYELTRASGEAEVARQEYEMLRDNPPEVFKRNPPTEDSLLFHGPQLDLARANLAAAKARLAETELNLSRTEIRAPYAARVRSEAVDVGQYLTVGKSVATLYSIDVAEIVFPVPDEDLKWIGGVALLQGKSPGPKVTVRAQRGGEEHQWPGRVVRTEGVVDPQTRMVHLVVEVLDPYRRGRAPLTVGLFVAGEIHGGALKGVVRLPRHALRENDTVWLAEAPGKLRVQPVEVARVTESEVLLYSGVKLGDRVIVSRIDAVTDGMKIRIPGGMAE